jgi:hypothetical protein
MHHSIIDALARSLATRRLALGGGAALLLGAAFADDAEGKNWREVRQETVLRRGPLQTRQVPVQGELPALGRQVLQASLRAGRRDGSGANPRHRVLLQGTQHLPQGW